MALGDRKTSCLAERGRGSYSRSGEVGWRCCNARSGAIPMLIHLLTVGSIRNIVGATAVESHVFSHSVGRSWDDIVRLRSIAGHHLLLVNAMWENGRGLARGHALVLHFLHGGFEAHVLVIGVRNDIILRLSLRNGVDAIATVPHAEPGHLNVVLLVVQIQVRV